MGAGDREAKVRVKLDTAEAKAELAALVQQAAGIGGRAGVPGTLPAAPGGGGAGGGDGGGGGGWGANLASSAFGTVRDSIVGQAQTDFGNIANEAFGPLGVQLSRMLFGNEGADAAASRKAREAIIGSESAALGARGIRAGDRVPDSTFDRFQAVHRIMLQAEEGTRAIEADPRFRSTSDNAKEIREGFDAMRRDLNDSIRTGGR